MARSKKKKKMFYGTVISPFTVRNHTYNVGDVYETDHEGSINYLITSKKLKK